MASSRPSGLNATPQTPPVWPVRVRTRRDGGTGVAGCGTRAPARPGGYRTENFPGSVQTQASGWYLNLHQGSSSNIPPNGQLTINCPPLLWPLTRDPRRISQSPP